MKPVAGATWRTPGATWLTLGAIWLSGCTFTHIPGHYTHITFLELRNREHSLVREAQTEQSIENFELVSEVTPVSRDGAGLGKETLALIGAVGGSFLGPGGAIGLGAVGYGAGWIMEQNYLKLPGGKEAKVDPELPIPLAFPPTDSDVIE